MENRHEEVDVLVIGAGVAGACAALGAARADRGARGRRARVVLVERSAWPREKVCGCCLGGGGIQALASVGISESDLLCVGQRLTEAQIRTGGQVVNLPLGAGVVVSRAELDAMIVERAVDAGVEFLSECSAKVLDGMPSGVIGHEQQAWTVSLSGRMVAARVVIVADGLGGRSLDGLSGEALGGELAVRVAPRAHMGAGALAVWGELAGPESAEVLPLGRVVLCTADDGAGYVGFVRLGDGRVDIAAALRPEAVKAAGGPGPLVAEIMDRAGLRANGAWPGRWEGRWQGTGLLTRARRRVAAPGLMIVGDAASYVEPFTGEGMSWAARAGVQAGRLAVSLPPEQVAAAWESWFAEHVRREQRMCRAVAGGLRVPGLAGAVGWMIKHFPPVRRAALAVAAHRGGGAA